jgi:hypothetical protein
MKSKPLTTCDGSRNEIHLAKYTVPLENLELSERMGIILSILNSPPMLILLTTLLGTLSSMFRSRAMLELENLALRHQVGVL